MTTTITIQNLKCGGCASTITDKLGKLRGVNAVAIDQEAHTVTLEHAHEVSPITIKEKLAALGYPPADAKNDLFTRAKSFVSCATGKMSNR